jgi:hypothetical protein
MILCTALAHAVLRRAKNFEAHRRNKQVNTARIEMVAQIQVTKRHTRRAAQTLRAYLVIRALAQIIYMDDRTSAAVVALTALGTEPTPTKQAHNHILMLILASIKMRIPS